MKNYMKEFKKFISRGNVVDLAVGVVVGSAFSKIVSSLVDNIIMPLVGIIIGGINFSSLTLNVFGVSVQYGIFLQNIVDFLIIAFCIFVVVKFINKLTNKEEKKETPKPAKPNQEILLEEIRDLLKEKKKTTKK